MDPTVAEVRSTLRQLRAAPKHFARAARGLDDDQLRRAPEKDAWSVNELLAHLRGCADVQGGWIERILAGDAPTIRYASPRTGMRKGGYASLEFHESLRGFSQQRAALVKTLSSLDLRSWCRGAAFTGTTPGWTQTVFELACGLASHEESHFGQITAAAQQPT